MRSSSVRATSEAHGRLGKVSVVTAGEPVSRQAGRVLVIDAWGRVLLLHGFDPAEPGRPYWFTVGGGAQHDESLAEAAVRELREETGLAAQPGDLGDPIWHEVAEFSFDGTRYRQEQDFFLLRVGSPDVRADGRDDEEAAVIDGHRWWTLSELEATTESCYPPELPGLLRALG